jgi:hypothetical protein
VPDPRINRDAVLATIYNPKNRRHKVWSASNTLHAMRIERYPHDPPTKLRQMKHVLKCLCDEGLLVLRPEPQKRFTLIEKAYERVAAIA